MDKMNNRKVAPTKKKDLGKEGSSRRRSIIVATELVGASYLFGHADEANF